MSLGIIYGGGQSGCNRSEADIFYLQQTLRQCPQHGVRRAEIATQV